MDIFLLYIRDIQCTHAVLFLLLLQRKVCRLQFPLSFQRFPKREANVYRALLGLHFLILPGLFFHTEKTDIIESKFLRRKGLFFLFFLFIVRKGILKSTVLLRSFFLRNRAHQKNNALRKALRNGEYGVYRDILIFILEFFPLIRFQIGSTCRISVF